MRLFEVVQGYEEKDIHLPQRATSGSAGYDIEAGESLVIPPFSEENENPIMVPTGVKVMMPSDEALFVYNRSSNPGKRGLVMANAVAVIDADYYGNADNDGHIYVPFYNVKKDPVSIRKGDRIAQGIFQPYLLTADDQNEGIRTGGFGSSGD